MLKHIYIGEYHYMTKENNTFTFTLNHFALMCKGWYISSDKNNNSRNLNFYKKILALDGYEYITNMCDVVTIVMRQYDVYNDWRKDNNMSYDTLYSFVQKITHYKRMYNIEDDNQAIILYVINTLAFSEGTNINWTEVPKYSRRLYKKGIQFGLLFGNPKKGMTYKEQNRIAQNIFRN